MKTQNQTSPWTPGPWSVCERPYSCTIQPPHDGPEAVEEIATIPNRSDTDRKEMLATARLIALAPEMAEALRAIVSWADLFRDSLAWESGKKEIEQARALLARLEGKA